MSNAQFYDRPLPHDLDAERAAIGSILIDESAVRIAKQILTGDDFFLERHQTIFRLVEWMIETGKPVDGITVKHELVARGQMEKVGGYETLAGLAAAVPSSLRIQHYAELVRSHALRRRLIAEAFRTHERCYDLDLAPEDVAAETIARVGEQVARAARSGDEQQAHFADFLAVLDEPAKPRVPTMMPSLDALIGGFPRGALSIIGARPSVGKTALACTIAFELAEVDVPSLFVSAEMPRREIVMRLACIASRVAFWRWERGCLEPHDAEILRKWAGVMSQSRRFAIFPCSSPAVGRIAAEAAYAVEKLGVKIIFVDYLQLCRPNTTRQDRREREVAEVCTGLLSIAQRHDVPVVALSQLNREGELRESDQLLQDAHVIIGLEAPFLDDERRSGEYVTDRPITATVRKNRNGRVGTAELVMLTQPMRFIGPGSAAPDPMARPATEPASGQGSFLGV